MILLIFIPILVSGYIFFLKNPSTFYKLHRFDGQLLYIKTAALGLLCTSLAILSISAIDTYLNLFSINSYLHNVFFKGIDDKYRSLMVWLLYVVMGSVFFAYFLGHVFKKKLYYKALFAYSMKMVAALQEDIERENKDKTLSKFEKVLITIQIFRLLSRTRSKGLKKEYKIHLMKTLLMDSPMDKIFFTSYDERMPLMLTLDDRKVYVGTVISLGEPTENHGMDQEIKITPFISGYRDRKTFEVNFTTFYPNDDIGLELVIKQEKVVSATEFNNDLYDELSKNSNFERDKTVHRSLINKRINR